ncbi:MAG: RNA-binding cell elongation regulator Jag/EloR [Caldilineaceae bacterium]
MATQTHEFKGKTIDDAIDEGLRTLHLSRSEVTIDVVQRGSRGIFGIGSEPAVVRLAPLTRVAEEPATPATPPAATESATVGATVSDTEAAAVQQASPHEATGDTARAQETATTEVANRTTPVAEAAGAPEPQPEDEVLTVSSAPTPAATTDNEDFDQEMMAMAADLLRQMVQLMGFEAEVRASWQEETDEADDDRDEEEEEADHLRTGRYLLLDIEGTDLGALIGRRGETLENIQYLLRLMVNQQIHQWKNIVVDVEHYKARRVTQLTQLAERMADQVARTGRSISLEPMPSNERRIVHMTLRGHPDVYTESYGDGGRRKVHIFAKS